LDGDTHWHTEACKLFRSSFLRLKFSSTVDYKTLMCNEAYATRLCSHTFSVGLIVEPREGWGLWSMLTPHQTNRTKIVLTFMCMEVTY